MRIIATSFSFCPSPPSPPNDLVCQKKHTYKVYKVNSLSKQIDYLSIEEILLTMAIKKPANEPNNGVERAGENVDWLVEILHGVTLLFVCVNTHYTDTHTSIYV